MRLPPIRSKRSRSAAITFEVASFEYLRTGESDVLLRLEGAWLSGREQAVAGIELHLARGEQSIVLDPLPDPSNFPVAATPSGIAWRAAFPTSLEHARDRSAAFALILGDGTIFELESPVDRDAPPEPEPAPVEEPDSAGAQASIAALPEADRIKAIIAESIQRFAVLEERIETERSARAETERRLAAAEAEQADAAAALSGTADVRGHLEAAVEQSEAARKHADDALDGALANVSSLESQLEATTRELEQSWADAEQRGAGFDAQLAELRAELDEARVEADKLQAVLEVANAARQAAEEQLTERASAEAALREQLAERERELAEARAQADVTALRLTEAEEALAELEARAAEAEQLTARTAELEQELSDARSATEAKTAEVKELSAWSAELESRVAEAGARAPETGDSDRLAARVSELESVLAHAEQLAENRMGAEQELREALASAEAEAQEIERRFDEADRAGEDLARRAREAEEAAAESAAALEAAVAERGHVEARLGRLEAELAEANQLAGAEAMAREELQREIGSGETDADEILKRELEQAREAAARERGQRASFEQELKRRDNVEFELRNSVEDLEGEIESLRGELASRGEMVSDLQRRSEDTRAALEAAEAAAAEARAARSTIEDDLRDLSETGDDAETALARHKTELADLRGELQESTARELEANRRIQELERGLTEAGDDAHRQQVVGELDRLKAAAGQATERFEQEARRRRQLEEELESRVVAEERLRAMLQAKVGTPRPAGDDNGAAEVDIPVSVDAAAATSQGDFLERLAAAKSKAASA